MVRLWSVWGEGWLDCGVWGEGWLDCGVCGVRDG